MFKAKKQLCAIGCSVALAASMCVPAVAFADDSVTTRDSAMTMQYIKTLTGDEEVPLDPTDSIGVKVPSTIPLAYRTDGSIMGPTADAFRIENKSLDSIYLDSNAVWGVGTGKHGLGFGNNTWFGLNGAFTNLPGNGDALNITLNLEFDDEASTKTTTYDPRITNSEGKTALTVGHPEVEGSVLSTNSIEIARDDSIGCGFTGDISVYSGQDKLLNMLYNDRGTQILDIATVTWTFNQNA